MNFKTTYILFGLLLGVMGVLLLSQLFGTRTKDQQVYVVPSLHDVAAPVRAEDINQVEITRTRPSQETLVFYQDAHGGWRLKNPNVRADGNKVRRIIDEVINAKRQADVDLPSDLGSADLANPPIVVKLVRKDGDREWTLNVGKETFGGSNALVFVSSSDDPNQPVAVRKLDLEMLDKPVVEFRAHDLLAESSFDINSVTLREPKHAEVALEKSAESKWKFDKPPFGDADYEGEQTPGAPPAGADQTISGVEPLLRAVADLRVESNDDFGPTDVSENELADKGLAKDKPGRLAIEVKRQKAAFGSDQKPEPMTDTLVIGKKADDKGDKLYARLASERNIVKVPAKRVDAIARVAENPSLLRNRDLVQADTARVDVIDVRIGDKDAVKLRRAGDPPAWKLYDAGRAQDADSIVVANLLSALTTRREIKEFPDPAKTDADLGLDKPAAVVSLWVDGIKKDEKKEGPANEEKKEEKKDEKKDAKLDAAKKDEKKEEKKDASAEPALKDAKPTVKLAFGRRERDLVYVRREAGTEVVRAAIPANLLDKVSEGRLAYLSRRLPGFAIGADVSKVTVVRGGQAVEVDKARDDKTAGGWKLVQPKNLAGRTADAVKVDRIVNEVRDLPVDKFVSEKPSDAELERLGLKQPAARVTVTVLGTDKKPEDHTVVFGKETDDKTGVYARQEKGDLVFVVRKGVLDALQGDLQDPTVFHLDLAKVKALKLTGWQDVVGSPITLDLERRAAQNWAVKAPAGFNLDTNQAEAFLNDLTTLKAIRFVGPAKPEYRLEVKDGALDIAVTVEGTPEPLTLTVGGPSGTEGFYSRSNKVPGEVFLLPKERFEKVKSRPAYFRRDEAAK